MLTIKHIHLSGAEYLYQSPTVRYSPGDDKQTHGEPATVWVDAGTFEQPLTGGTIFVMNEKGSTVARYDLGASMVPLGGAEGEVRPVVSGTYRYPEGGSHAVDAFAGGRPA